MNAWLALPLLPLFAAAAAAQDRPDPERDRRPPPQEEDEVRDSWGCLNIIFPTDFDGKVFARENGMGARLNFNDDFGLDVRMAMDLNIHFCVDPEGGFMIVDFSGVWFEGSETFKAPSTYGGKLYPAGSAIKSEGHWIWYELGYGYQFWAVDDALQLFAGFSFAFDSFEIQQTQQYVSTYTVMIGGRGGVIFRPVPFFAAGIEVGAWTGGAKFEADHDDFAASSWSTLLNVWVAIDIHPNVSLRFGYYVRMAAAEAEHNRHSKGPGGVVTTTKEDQDLFMRMGGPMIAVEFHY